MKLLRISLTAIAAITLLASAKAANDFDSANEQYGSGNYEQAARSYHLALDKGIQSAEIYYNLGLTEAKAGKIGQASLNFQRALTLAPGLAPARKELEELAVKSNFEIPPTTWKTRIASSIPLASLWTGGAVVAWLGLFIMLGGFFAKTRRGTLLIVGGLILILGKATLFLALVSDPLIQNENRAVIVMDGANRLRSAPVENSETVTSLVGGSTVTILSERGKWAYCATLDGKRGWIERQGVEPIMPRTSSDH